MRGKCIVLVGLLMGLLFLAGCSAHTTEHSPGPGLIAPPQMRTPVARVERGPVGDPYFQPAIGMIHSEGIGFPNSSGRLGWFYVFPGDEVVEGQLLARIDAEALMRSIEAQEAVVADLRWRHNVQYEAFLLQQEATRVEVALAMAEAAQAFDIAGMEAAERRELDLVWQALLQRQAEAFQALDLQEALEELAQLRNQMQELELRAPHDGIVTNVLTQLQGTWVVPGQSIMQIARHGQDVYFRFVGHPEFPFWIFNNIQRTPVRIEAMIDGQVYEMEYVPASQYFWFSLGDFAWWMPVYRNYRAVGRDAPQIGEYIDMRIYFERLEDVLRVPRQAVFAGGGGTNYVYRIIDGQPVATRVRVLMRTYSFVAIEALEDDIHEGDEIVAR